MTSYCTLLHHVITLCTYSIAIHLYFIFCVTQAVTYEQHGYLEQAQATYELCMSKARADIAVRPAPGKLQSEMKLWEERWIR